MPSKDASSAPSSTPSLRPSSLSPLRPTVNLFIDTGKKREDTSIVTGTTWRYKNDVRIAGTVTPEYFQTHRSGPSFAYTISGLVPLATYKLQLGFAEIWPPKL
jgi:endonuclease YncB( thermonuclease family)